MKTSELAHLTWAAFKFDLPVGVAVGSALKATISSPAPFFLLAENGLYLVNGTHFDTPFPFFMVQPLGPDIDKPIVVVFSI